MTETVLLRLVGQCLASAGTVTNNKQRVILELYHQNILETNLSPVDMLDFIRQPPVFFGIIS